MHFSGPLRQHPEKRSWYNNSSPIPQIKRFWYRIYVWNWNSYCCNQLACAAKMRTKLKALSHRPGD